MLSRDRVRRAHGSAGVAPAVLARTALALTALALALLVVAVPALLAALVVAPPAVAEVRQAQAATAVPRATCPALDVPGSTKSAEAVFVGTVASAATVTAKTDGTPGALYDQPVTVQTVFQGRIRTDTVEVQTDRTPKQCSLGALTVGRSYMFFVQGDGDPWVAVSGGGTSRATTTLVARVRSILGDGRPMVEPTPAQASFAALHPAAPRTLVRTAAPGIAMVIVGLLGLVLVRRR